MPYSAVANRYMTLERTATLFSAAHRRVISVTLHRYNAVTTAAAVAAAAAAVAVAVAVVVVVVVVVISSGSNARSRLAPHTLAH